MGTYDHVTDWTGRQAGYRKWVSGGVFMGSTRFPPGWRVEVLSIRTYEHTQYTRLNAHILPGSYNNLLQTA